MKTHLIGATALSLSILSSFAGAQSRSVEITPFVGYQVGGRDQSRLGQFSIDGAVSYGAMLDLRVRPDATIQFLYDRQETTLDFRDTHPFFPTRVRLDLSIEYFHFGGTVEFGETRFRPYFALTLGASRFHPQREELSDEWRFSLGTGFGFKSYVNERFGFRADARVWPTFLNTRGGIFCSAPGGCLVSVEADFLVQGNATVGLFFTF